MSPLTVTKVIGKDFSADVSVIMETVEIATVRMWISWVCI